MAFHLIKGTKNLHIFTGKGGVGKTTCSLSFCQYLQGQGQKCVYLTFDEGNAEDLSQDKLITHLNFEVWDCVKQYLEKKFSSKMISNMILKTPFFRALIKMVPGFRYVIYMGRLVHLLQENKDIVYVLDSPSSGHLVTLFESVYLFKNIFGGGILAKDLTESLEYWNTQSPYSIHIIALAKPSVLQESLELQSLIEDKFSMDSKIYLNSSLPMALKGVDSSELPEFLQKKRDSESLATQDFQGEIDGELPYISTQEYKKLLKELSPSSTYFLS